MIYSIGVDVGGTTVKMGLFQADGVLIEKWEIPSFLETDGRQLLLNIAASVREKFKSYHIMREDIAGLGIGVPGPVSPDGFVETCVNLSWSNVDLVNILTGHLDGLPVKASNDANIAALGEQWQGGGKGYDSLVAFTLGTGIGGGLVVAGEILSGAHGLAGEIGHVVLNTKETVLCNCGNRGCLEQYSSATGIVNEMKKALADNRAVSQLGGRKNFTSKDVVDAAKNRDVLALSVLNNCMDYLGQAMALIAHIIDPEVILIGGGVSKAGDFLIDMVKPYFNKYFNIIKERPAIVLATLGNDAGIYGAARMALGNGN